MSEGMQKLEMKAHGQPGKLITFCGLDGCGKTTMISTLEKHLVSLGYEVVVTKQPTDFVRGMDIFRTFMDEPRHDQYEYRALSLFAAGDRVQHSNQFVLPHLRKGRVVISDRYFHCCLANLRARGYKKDQWIYEIVRDIPKPDLAFFLDVDVELAMKRVRERQAERDRYIDVGLQYRLRQEFLDIAEVNEGVVVSTQGSVEEAWRDVGKMLVECI